MLILDIFARVISLALTVTSYAMALRMILPLFVNPEDSKVYFFTCLLSGATPEESLRTAAAASAIAVSRMGAAPSIPTMDEVKNFLMNK